VKYARTATAILILLLIGLNLDAGEIITWTGEDGDLNITNLSPPSGVKIQNVIQYKEETGDWLKEYKRLQQKKRQDRLKHQKIQDAKKAKNEVEKAKKDAEDAIARAECAVQRANEYTNKLAPRNRRKRDAYRSRTRMFVKEAEKAQAQAGQALKKAKQDEKKAREATKIVQEFDSQNPQALQSDLQEPERP